jgi:probable phosphoglycerate mutase
MTSEALPRVYLVRHGQTAWSLSGRHTGLSDPPLTAAGEGNARRLGARLKGMAFSRVLCSPLRRAADTCALAGFGHLAQPDARLVEWHYGAYEGRSSAEILALRPAWSLFRDGCPGGELPAEVAARADSVIATLRACAGQVLVFSSAHFLRMLAVRWLGLDMQAGASFALDTGSLSVLGYEHSLQQPAIRLWNEDRHVEH